MRYVLGLLLAVLLVLYFTIGLRIGYITLSATYLFNASGTNSYPMDTKENGQKVGVTGTCNVKSGEATIRLINTQGQQLAGQVCRGGNFSLNVIGGGGPPQVYTLEVIMKKYTGTLTLEPQIQGKW